MKWIEQNGNNINGKGMEEKGRDGKGNKWDQLSGRKGTE